jgi:hypothetical protein
MENTVSTQNTPFTEKHQGQLARIQGIGQEAAESIFAQIDTLEELARYTPASLARVAKIGQDVADAAIDWACNKLGVPRAAGSVSAQAAVTVEDLGAAPQPRRPRLGLSSAALAVNFNPDAVRSAGDVAGAFVMLLTEVHRKLFTPEKLRMLRLPSDIMDEIDAFLHDLETGQTWTAKDMTNLSEAVSKLFDPRFQRLLQRSQELARTIGTMDLMQSSALIGPATPGYNELFTLTPLIAEWITNQFEGQRIGSQAKRGVAVIERLMTILTNPRLQQSLNAYNPQNPELGAIAVCQRLADEDIANKMRLAFAYQQMFYDLADITTPPAKDQLLTIGDDTILIGTYFSMLAAGEVANSADPFRRDHGFATSAVVVVGGRRFRISVDLKLSVAL